MEWCLILSKILKTNGVLVSLFITYLALCKYLTLCSGVSIVNFEHVIAGWERASRFSFYVACYLYFTESF